MSGRPVVPGRAAGPVWQVRFAHSGLLPQWRRWGWFRQAAAQVGRITAGRKLVEYEAGSGVRPLSLMT
jgi:hypothetical protein